MARPLDAAVIPAHLVVLLLCLQVSVTAQQPESAGFQVVRGGPAVTDERLRSVAEMTRMGLARLAQFFPGTPNASIRIVVHDDEDSIQPKLRQSLHPGVPGFARLRRNEIHLVLDEMRLAPPNDLQSTVDHELVHTLLDQYAGENSLSVPRWFHEGLAQVLAETTYLGVREEDLIYRARTRSYLPFYDLLEDFPTGDAGDLALAYGQSFSFVAFLRREVGLKVMLEAARACRPGQSFDSVLSDALGEGLVVYEERWIDYILHESGAGFRVVMRNCFLILLVAVAIPLLAVAVARRRNREVQFKQQMAQAESEERAAEERAAEEHAAEAQDDETDFPEEDRPTEEDK